MSDDHIDIEVIDVRGLSPAQREDLGDTALGHAVRRLLISNEASARDEVQPIAAFQDSM